MDTCQTACLSVSLEEDGGWIPLSVCMSSAISLEADVWGDLFVDRGWVEIYQIYQSIIISRFSLFLAFSFSPVIIISLLFTLIYFLSLFLSLSLCWTRSSCFLLFVFAGCAFCFSRQSASCF